jgi:hypothetical protein
MKTQSESNPAVPEPIGPQTKAEPNGQSSGCQDIKQVLNLTFARLPQPAVLGISKAAKKIQAFNEAKLVRTTVSHLSGEQSREAEAALQRLQGAREKPCGTVWKNIDLTR